MASKNNIKLNIEGFDELLKKIEDAGGSIKETVDECMRTSAQIQQDELKEKMKKKQVSSGLIERMPAPEIKWIGNACIARVGYKKGNYDPHNLSDGYKAVFINYGTPRISPRKFIDAAQKSAKRKIKKEQAETLQKIIGRVAK